MHKMQPLCSIIIPVLNQCRYTRQCLEFLFRSSVDSSFELLLVDNGSTDETAKLFDEYEERYAQVRSIRFPENRGFSIANNVAAEQASGDYLIFLNNDTIPTHGWLAALVEAARLEGVGAVGSKLVYPHSNSINHAGYVYNQEMRDYYPIYHGFWSENPVVNKQREYQALLGAALLVERKLFQHIGGFADYGLEDIDLCLKVREQGRRVVYCPRSKVYHYGSITLGNTPPSFMPMRTNAHFKQRWRYSERLWDDLKYYQEDGFEIEVLPSKEIRLWRKDNPALQISIQAEQAVKRGDFKQALQLAQEACDHDPRSRELRMLRTGILSKLGDQWAKINSIMEIITLDPLYFEGYLLAAQALIGLGHPQEASRLLEAALSSEYLPFDVREAAQALQEKLAQ